MMCKAGLKFGQVYNIAKFRPNRGHLENGPSGPWAVFNGCGKDSPNHTPLESSAVLIELLGTVLSALPLVLQHHCAGAEEAT